MIPPRSIAALPLLLALAVAACAPEYAARDPEVEPELTLDGDRVRFRTAAAPAGEWSLELTGFASAVRPGDTLDWAVEVDVDGFDGRAALERIEELRLVLAARRMADAEGHYRSPDAYFGSTYLTPSGLPVEGFQYFIASSHIGGPYRTPLDHQQVVPLDAVEARADGLSFATGVSARLADDFPAGLYRVELGLFAAVDGVWYPLHVVGGAADGDPGGCDPGYERVYYSRLLLPPMTVGTPAPPRAIWTLFTSATDNGVPGVVAAEDEGQFALSSRVKPTTRYRLPCTPGRGRCVMALEPELPTVKLARFDTSALEPDLERGEARIRVTRPDGVTEDLGTHGFHADAARARAERAPRWRLYTGVEYAFEQPGRYQIVVEGEMYDRFGTRYEAGGRYEAWLAHPLTFATGIKPGTPMRVGDHYSAAATINPPVPADVVATVRFFPGDGGPALEGRQQGRAQRFGYFFPDPAQEPLVFPAGGEYLFDLFAEYHAPDGQVFMGHQRNASVVLPEGPAGLEIWGDPDAARAVLAEPASFTLSGDENSVGTGPLLFPYRTGDNLYFAGNGPYVQFVQPSMSVSEPSGDLQRVLREEFPPALVRLRARDHGATGELDYRAFPGPVEGFRRYATGTDGRNLPLMSTTSAGYSPFEYPELVDRAGYFYVATSRPGFPAFFAVGDSTMTEDYWMNAFAAYEGTLGAARRGDQPGDVYWSLVTGLFADRPARRSFYGVYSSGGVAGLRGDWVTPTGPPFGRPVATINGVDVDIYAGVGPAPGFLVETGAVKGVGSIAVPMVPHDVRIELHEPDGQVHECVGRADAIGNFSCPAGPVTFDQPGVYRVYARFSEGAHEGWCAGARDGWYQVYAVDAASTHRVLFDAGLAGAEVPADRLAVTGRVDPAPAEARAWYSVVAPGILLDEGELPVVDGRFELTLLPDQLGAEFVNLHDNPHLADEAFLQRMLDLRPVDPDENDEWLRLLARGLRERILSDTVEVTVFVEGADATGAPLTAGGKLVLRGERVVVPPAFLDRGGAR